VASVAYLDTHVVSWLYAGRTDLLPDRVRETIQERDILISPMVRLELQYLYEIGRTRTPAAKVIQELAGTIGLKLCSHPFPKVIERAERQSWTRDPFDRVIVAQAALEKSVLVTKDRSIRSHYGEAVWD
jgi:PIN domain nuclease of toxin-antitoxin system